MGFKIPLTLNLVLLVLQLWVMGAVIPFSATSIVPLFLPIIVLANLAFMIFWVFRMRWPFILFLITFLLSFKEWRRFYKFPSNTIEVSKGLKIMSFNVRLFNLYDWKNDRDIPSKIEQFIREEDPDILCFQEYAVQQAPTFANYKYRYIKTSIARGNHGMALFSKYPLVNTGNIAFEESSNSSIFADILYRRDTLRVYNLHLESLHLNQADTLISSSGSKKLVQRLQGIFDKQLEQLDRIAQNQNLNTLPSIVCADLNNTAFSKAYQTLKGELLDGFEEKGTGFGATYHFGVLPYRIDYIFADPRFKILNYKTHGVSLSDHRPISAEIYWR